MIFFRLKWRVLVLQTVKDDTIWGQFALDLSAAFDTVDHSILCKRLRLTFGLDGQVLEWFRSYLHGRSQYVRRGMLKSLAVLLVCEVPQGSVLGLILFILYTAELIGLIEQHGFCLICMLTIIWSLQAVSYTGPTAASVGVH